MALTHAAGSERVQHRVFAAFGGPLRPTGIGRWCPAEHRAVRVVGAPVAQPRRMRTEIACGSGGLDGSPDRDQRLLEPLQLVEIGGVVQHLAVGQIKQPQPGGQHPARAQQCDRVELHLEHRLELGQRARLWRRLAGLVVDHPHLTGGCDVDAVDEPAQQSAVGELDLDALLAALRVEARRILEPVVTRQQRPGLLAEVRPQRRARCRRQARAGRRPRGPTPARPATSRSRALDSARAGRRAARGRRAPPIRAAARSTTAPAAGRWRGTGTAAGTA